MYKTLKSLSVGMYHSGSMLRTTCYIYCKCSHWVQVHSSFEVSEQILSHTATFVDFKEMDLSYMLQKM